MNNVQDAHAHPPPEALDPQRRAADPALSVWVAASAGTGKTKVLTDRLLRLLLAGAPPQRLLCLTFTKAGAAEMANRLADTLAAWATGSDAALTCALKPLLGTLPDAEADRRTLFNSARSLFARVLDAPGGLAIQTIHAFCQTLLARFPLEAGVPPGLTVLDDSAQAALLRRARDAVLADPTQAAALASVTAEVGEDRFDELINTLLRERDRLDRLFAAPDPDRIRADLAARVGILPEETPAALRVGAWEATRAARRDLAAAVDFLRQGSSNDVQIGAALHAVLADPNRAADDAWTAYSAIYLTKDRTPRKLPMMTKKTAALAPDLAALLEREKGRVAAIDEKLAASAMVQRTDALLRLARQIRETYAELKQQHGRLDYDDMIIKARDLLTAGAGAAWVLFKIDGGIDHVLVDEAQDTNPEQWEIVRAITGEFFAGQGQSMASRSLFVVGDAKQSIFSFQRADPDKFLDMRAMFERLVTGAGQRFSKVDLTWSFRSGPAVLEAVDAVFADSPARDGVVEAGATIKHRPVFADLPGSVELWPLAPVPDKDAAAPWQVARPEAGVISPKQAVARAVAGTIAGWLDRGERRGRGQVLRPGDIMILVRNRGDFVPTLVADLKAKGIPVAGVDRMVLTDQIAVKDLIAFGRFLLLPEDDLNLAALLRSPLVGIDDQTLFELAWDRPGSVWQRVRRHPDPRLARLRVWQRQAAALPPFEIFAQLLGPEGGRAALLAQLGPESLEPLDEFLDRARAFEHDSTPTLEGFLHWLEGFATEVKRDNDQGRRDEVRILTVHASKGLQAPVVFLPDAARPSQDKQRIFWDTTEPTDGINLPFWLPRKNGLDPVSQARRAQAEARGLQEHRRLLYVAMTRAAERLIIAGWETGKRANPEQSWHHLVRAGLTGRAEVIDTDFSAYAAGWTGACLRLERGSVGPATVERPDAAAPPRPDLPGWARRRPEEPAASRPLIPTARASPPAARSPAGVDAARRYQRGTLIHRLLQSLPNLPPDQRASTARRWLTAPAQDLSDSAADALIAEVLAILDTPDFAPLFGPNSRAEVPLAGIVAAADGARAVVSGQVDRLCVADDAVLVVDYKTNRPPPTTPEAVDPGYLRQMAAYVGVLRQIYPGRTISAALLWTDGPRLMPLPAALLAAYPGGDPP